MSLVLNGKLVADQISMELKERAAKLGEKGIPPELIIVTASKDPASKIYVNNKIKRAKEIGIEVEHLVVDDLTWQDMDYVSAKNVPCIVQMPFESSELKANDLGDYIAAWNDVDGFVNWDNVAQLAMGGEPCNYPCTPLGVVELLHRNHIRINGKTVCILGRSNIVGRPLARMFEHENATVTLCHSKTDPVDILYTIKTADIIVTATGCPNTITMEMMREAMGQSRLDIERAKPDTCLWDKVFIDVGMNRDQNGKLCGDIPEEVKKHGAAYTPVPGGIGPMTVVMLMKNVIEAYEGIAPVKKVLL